MPSEIASAFRGPAPKTILGRHRVLSPAASIRVSPLILGTANFGTAWDALLGPCSKETAFKILDHYYEGGGNFIDTANYYQDTQSEAWLGEWLALRKNRDEIVLASKYSANTMLPFIGEKGNENIILSNYGGNNPKSLKLSVEGSLKRLGTSYLDILYVHWWDFATSAAELMTSLNRMVIDGKVLYLGASDMPAWFVVKCNAYARQFNMAPFIIYTGKWSVAERDIEREILDMCAAEDMAVAPFYVLGGGRFKTPEQRKKETAGEGRVELYPESAQKFKEMENVLNGIAEKKGTLPTSVALAYVLQKQAYVFPLVGTRKVEYLEKNIEALSVRLEKEELEAIVGASDWVKGFPYDVLTLGGTFDGPDDLALMTGTYDYVKSPEAIRPAK